MERTLAAAHDDQVVEINPNMVDLYRRKVGELQTLLADEITRPQAMDLIRTMINRIEIHVGAEHGKPDVILVGALAQILAFTQQNKTAASIENDGRVSVVAGACNIQDPTIAINV